MSQLQDVRDLLMWQLKRAIQAGQSDGYLSATGIPKDKRPIDRQRETAAIDMWSKAVWIANQDAWTPHYWRMKAFDEITETTEA